MTKVERYLDAVRERNALQDAIRYEGETPQRLAALRQAKERLLLAYGKLTGGEIAQARRQLAGTPA
jgi:hypothetical protein